VEAEFEAPESGEAGIDLACFPFRFAAAFRRVMAFFDTPMMCRMAAVNLANSGLSGGFFMGL
jgi:hypothetical protein